MIGHTEAEQRARATGRPVLVARTIELTEPVQPLTWFAAGHARFGEAMLLERPEDRTLLLGLGVVDDLRLTGTHAVRSAAGALAAADEIARDDATAAFDGPIRLAGFAFDPAGVHDDAWAAYPDGRVVVPRVLLRIRDGVATATIAYRVAPDGDGAREDAAAERDLDALRAAPLPPAPAAAVAVFDAEETPNDWRNAVARTAAEIRAGDATKVVLARRIRARLDGDVDVVTALARMREKNPTGCVFAVAEGEVCFVGATPERLVRLHHGRFETDALAGTVARGADAAEDDVLARRLFASAKDRLEHDVVVRWLRTELGAICEEVATSPEPRIRALGTVQHLYTPIWGRVAPGRSVLDLVARLHPTPAVAGVPRDGALRTIRARERFDRGWYAGPIGWIDAAGGGEFVVAIRSALLAPATATLFAGGGIVGDSEPAAEVEETRLKLGAMLAALGLGT